MVIRRSKYLKALIPIVATASLLTQGMTPEEALQRRFRSVMTSALPEFTEQLSPGKSSPPRSNVSVWRQGDARVVVDYRVTNTDSEASRLIRSRAEMSEIAVRPLAGMGDEAYEVAPYSTSGERRLHFRKGPVVVSVSAPGEEGVRSIARLLLQQVVDAQRAGLRP